MKQQPGSNQYSRRQQELPNRNVRICSQQPAARGDT
jgi:hypothetical protein